MKCTNCGNKIRNPINFCPYCRTSLNQIALTVSSKSKSSLRKYFFILILLLLIVTTFYFLSLKDINFLMDKFSSSFNKFKTYTTSLKEKSITSLPKTFIEPKANIEFILLKGGCFNMGDTFGDGDSDEKPVVQICVQDFYMSKYEITQGQWLRLIDKNPSYFKDLNLPVDNVNMNDLLVFLSHLNQNNEKIKYKLPTEVEWEYACKSGAKGEKYSGTSNETELKSYSWFGTTSAGKPHHVGMLKANSFGLFDLSGNVWEWTESDYSPDCYNFMTKGSHICKGTFTGNKVIRGGSWNLSERFARCSARRGADPLGKAYNIGFRIVAIRQ